MDTLFDSFMPNMDGSHSNSEPLTLRTALITLFNPTRVLQIQLEPTQCADINARVQLQALMSDVKHQ